MCAWNTADKTVLSRRAFVVASGLGLTSLVGCSGSSLSAPDDGKEPAANVAADTQAAETSRRTRPGANPYSIDFITTLGPGEDLVATASATPGSIQELTYTAHSYVLEATEGQEITLEKRLLVYLPYDYDASKTYNILYLLHGTDGDEGYWLGNTEGHAQETLNLLDALHDQRLIEPTIVVCPSYYSWPDYEGGKQTGWSDPHADDWPAYFWKELRRDIVPLVEKTFSTPASGDTSDASLAATRGRRAFAGLSRGSETSVKSVMMHCLDWFGSIGSFSGIWQEFDEFEQVISTDFAGLPIDFWYNGNGSNDFSLEPHQEFVAQALERMPDRFKDGENYAWIEFPGGNHDYQSWSIHLHNALLAFFGA